MDAVGFGIKVALLVPLFFACWYLQRLSRVEIGLVCGRRRDYVLAVLYPVVVLALIALIPRAAGAATMEKVDWLPTLLNLAGQIAVTAVFAIVTVEGIFRGWLWGAHQRAGVGRFGILAWTSVAGAARGRALGRGDSSFSASCLLTGVRPRCGPGPAG